MTDSASTKKTCVIIGASHAGVNCAFALRKDGWEGAIILYDSDPNLPYHRPPLSKGYLTGTIALDGNVLKPKTAYEKTDILLCLGVSVKAINNKEKTVSLSDGKIQPYTKLILATGGRPIVPPIKGLKEAKNCFTMRTRKDAQQIQETVLAKKDQKVVVIGGGYIGLEIASSLERQVAQVTILERESRVLTRVVAPELSDHFEKLHTKQGVTIATQKNVITVESKDNLTTLYCEDGGVYTADVIIIGVGIHVNDDLGTAIGLTIENGIKVDGTCRTSDPNIFAIGDCTNHFNEHYQRWVRLESVQNAVDQAKIAAASVCGKQVIYDAIPWFWSDQYDTKLQMVGLSEGYTETLLRKERDNPNSFSVWYFKSDNLLAVNAVNNPKAYVLGMKLIKSRSIIDKEKLVDSSVSLKQAELVAAIS